MITEGSKGLAINSQVIVKTTLVQALRGEKQSISNSNQRFSSHGCVLLQDWQSLDVLCLTWLMIAAELWSPPSSRLNFRVGMDWAVWGVAFTNITFSPNATIPQLFATLTAVKMLSPVWRRTQHYNIDSIEVDAFNMILRCPFILSLIFPFL